MMAAMLHVERDGIEALLGDDLDGQGIRYAGPCGEQRFIGRKAGPLPNYNYSSAMKRAELVWDRATLDRFISNPDQVIPGNSMKPYSGLSSAEERAKIITFLEANGGD